jgi:AcrR family transcriptional regulator
VRRAVTTTKVPRRAAASAARTEQILRVATKHFFEHGYSGASIDAIVAEAGGSKRRIYEEFGGKEGLFTTIVRNNVSSAIGALSEDEVEQKSLKDTLLAFGQGLTTLLTNTTGLSFFRIIIAEGVRFPALARTFYDSGPGMAVERLTEVLERRKRAKEIEVRDCRAAADHFIGMLRGNLLLEVLLGLRPRPKTEELQAFVAEAVDTFLHGIARSGKR